MITQTDWTTRPRTVPSSLGRPLAADRGQDRRSGHQARPSRAGSIGELCTRGYHVMHGYFDNPEATAAAIDAEGWLHTGDLGSMDERGYCRIEGRLKDMIIRGGENIYPREIEQVLFDAPGRRRRRGGRACPTRSGASRSPRSSARRPAQTPTADELFAYCREHLAPHKTPRHWEFVDELPD